MLTHEAFDWLLHDDLPGCWAIMSISKHVLCRLRNSACAKNVPERAKQLVCIDNSEVVSSK